MIYYIGAVKQAAKRISVSLFLALFAFSLSACKDAKLTLSSPIEDEISTSPTIISISPIGGPLAGGTSITISGKNFDTASTVKIGDITCGSAVAGLTSITCTTPAGSGLQTVTVTTGKGETASYSGFSYNPVPTLSSLSISTATTAGGTAITLTGTGFLSNATVAIGTSYCSSVIVSTSTTINCLTPVQLAGSRNVSVMNYDSQSSGIIALTYSDPPVISSVSPTVVDSGGGTELTVTGANFAAGGSITVGANTCTGYTFDSSTQVRCTTPANSIGVYSVTLTNANGLTGSLSNSVTYGLAPTISSISPSSGFLTGGGTLVITGTNFVGGSTVMVGDGSCPVTSQNATTIACTLASNTAGAKAVVVTNPDTLSATYNSYTYVPPPSISTLSYTQYPTYGGAMLTIYGSNFISAPSVQIGAFNCGSVNWVNSTEINCLLPTVAWNEVGAYNVVVTNPDTQTATLTNGFTYYGAASISSISIVEALFSNLTGQTLTITGSGFEPGAIVKIDGSSGTPCTGASVTLLGTQITCTLPAMSAYSYGYSVYVENPTTNYANYYYSLYYLPTIAVTTIAPSTANINPGSILATIYGSGFMTGVSVTVGGNTCTGLTKISNTELTCYLPSGTAGYANIVATNPDTNSATLASYFQYVTRPIVTSVGYPAFGPLAGGQTVTIFGNGFQVASTVKIGGITCSSVNIISPNQLTCVTGANTKGIKTVVVTNPALQDSLEYVTYEYVLPPKVRGTHLKAQLAGSSPYIYVYGDNFILGATIDIGGQPCTSANFINSRKLTCYGPSGLSAGGPYNMSVTNPDNQSGAANTVYTVASTLSASSTNSSVKALPSIVPNDNSAESVIWIVPRTSSGLRVADYLTIQVTSDSANVTMSGGGTCGTNCEYATIVSDGTYMVRAKSSFAHTANFTAASTTPNVTFLEVPSVTFSAGFTFISTNTTIDNTYSGLNLYITSGVTATFDATTVGVNFGNIFVNGGTITHPATTTSIMNKLDIGVSSLSLQNGGIINARDLGYPSGYSYGGTGGTPSTALATIGATAGASHGGDGGHASGELYTNIGLPYDDYKNPEYPGGGAQGAAGGGVIKINSSGPCMLRYGTSISASSTVPGGAGGSVNLNCSILATDDSFYPVIDVSSAAAAGSISAGGGGRVAITTPYDKENFYGYFIYPDNICARDTMYSRIDIRAGTWSTNGMGGSGTLFMKYSGLTYGDLFLNQRSGYSTTYDGRTRFISTTVNSNTIFNAIGGSTTATVTNGGTPFANMIDIFKGSLLHVFNTIDPLNPLDISHYELTLSGNFANTFEASIGTFPLVSANHYYRIVNELDHLEVGDYSVVDLNGSDLIVHACDYHSGSANEFSLTGSSIDNPVITGINSLASPYCLNSSVDPARITATNLFMQ